MAETDGVCMLIIYTVGGSPEAIVASLKHHRPRRAVFVPSPQTKADIEGILSMLRGEGIEPPVYDVKPVPDAQDFELCVKTLRELEPLVLDWIHQSRHDKAAVDLTGGTKLMSAALALVARRWPCEFLYVGGKERSKNGVGVVLSGKEQFVYSANPWDSLGYQTIEEATLLFNEGNFAAAAHLAESARNCATDASAKKVLQAFKELAESYEAWDRFDHQAADSGLGSILAKINDLGHALPGKQHLLEALIKKHREFLGRLLHPDPDVKFLTDLLANARRRAEHGRFDDAVARLYRVVEAAAQIHLGQCGFPATAKVPFGQLPSTLQVQWNARVQDGFVRLSLQDDYELLRTLGEPLGKRFFDLGLDQRDSPLTARNQSILAHGFQPVREKVFQDLWRKSLQLVKVPLDSLPEFPRLGGDRI